VTDLTSYDELIEAAIEKEKGVLGDDAALEAADSVDGFSTDDEGNVTALEGNGKEVLGRLVEKYEDVGGQVTASLIARKIKKAGGEDLDLPDNLAERI
jgi:hypothetical protein